MNSYASRFQNFYAATVLGGGKLNKDLGNQLADAVLKINEGVNSNTLAAGAQSSAAWLIYMAQQKIWDGDAKKVQELVDAYMKSVIEYGVACCHHTCKNLEWNSKIIQLSSLTPAQKQKFAEILAQATQTDPLYQMDQELNTQGKQGDSGNSAESGETGNQNANVLSNSTSQNSKSDGSNAGGKTAVGDDLSQSGDAKSQADSSSSQDASSGGESTGGAKSYELSESSTSKSASSTESSMPMFVIIAVIVLIAIFLFGYVRKDDEDYDEY